MQHAIAVLSVDLLKAFDNMKNTPQSRGRRMRSLLKQVSLHTGRYPFSSTAIINTNRCNYIILNAIYTHSRRRHPHLYHWGSRFHHHTIAPGGRTPSSFPLHKKIPAEDKPRIWTSRHQRRRDRWRLPKEKQVSMSEAGRSIDH